MSTKDLAKGASVLATGRYLVRKRAPYWSAGVYACVPTPVPGFGTVGVDERARLFYDPSFMAKMSPGQVAFVVAHEWCHIAWKTHARCKGRDKAAWNIAADLYINASLWRAGWTEPPPGGCFPQGVGPPDAARFRDCPDGLTTEEYYERLMKHAVRVPMPGACNGWDGPNPVPGQPGSGEEQGQGQGQEQGADEKDQPAPGSTPGRTPAELERARRAVAEAVKQAAARGQGSVPAEWAVWAGAQLEPPVIPWQTVINRRLRGLIANVAGAVDTTWRRVSRRQAGLGFGIGVPRVPSLCGQRPRVLLVLDTSGSMNSLGPQVLGESVGVVRAVGGQVEIWACDAAIASRHTVASRGDVARLKPKGGGGTDFRPVFDEVAARRPHARPHVLIYITDSYGAYPAQAPKGLCVIWAHIGAPKGTTVPFGEVVDIDKARAAGAGRA